MRVFGLSVLIAGSVVALEAFAVAQTNPPPQDYQQQQPPPGYAPPPGYQQQPPPGYQQQPPPGYQQQPPPPQAYGYGQQPGYGAPPPAGKHGFLALPYLGIESHQGTTGDGLSAGFMLGALLGGRVNPNISINGELRIDVLNPKNVPSGVDVTAYEADIAFSPLYHVPLPSGEFVVGPKVGVFAGSIQASYGGTSGPETTVTGFALGFNSGVFFDINPRVALGGMLSFTVRDPHEVCQKQTGYPDMCDSSGSYTSEKVLGFHGAALF